MEKQAGRSVPYRQSLSMRFMGPVFIAWSGAAVYALSESESLIQKLAEVPVAAGMILFVFFHGLRSYGRRALLVFTALVFLIAWGFEMLSIMTGFPFGSYTYTERMRPYIGHVPALVLPVYWVMGYVCWSMARILLGLGPRKERTNVIFMPLVAAALMVTWDLSMDPLRSTLEMRWVWADGGAHYGVPLSNFFGWFLVTWTMFLSFALYLRSRHADQVRETPSKSPVVDGHLRTVDTRFWITIPLMYLTFAIEHMLRPFSVHNAGHFVAINGATRTVADFVSEIAFLTGMTMLPIAVLGLSLVLRRMASPTSISSGGGHNV